MAKILITGGSGFLGQNLATALLEKHEVVISSRNHKQLMSAAKRIGIESAPIDVSSRDSVNEIIRKIKPQIIVHAAATKFVDLAEKFPNECIDINVIGSQNIARSAMENNVEFVVGISTDKVTSPITNIYGMSKAVMERLYCSLDNTGGTRFACVRYGNVAWSTGSVFPIWEKMAQSSNMVISSGPDMSRFFFSVEEAVELVTNALTNMNLIGGKILSLPMKGTLIRRILDIWSGYSNFSWKIGPGRIGDRPLEYLISELESFNTRELLINGKSHFLLDIHNSQGIDSLKGLYSSKSADQLSDSEILALIRNKPNVELI